ASGIMIDRSLYPTEENIAVTARVAEYCEKLGIGVEGEIGHVGIAANGDEQTTEYTTAAEAKDFVDKTHVCALAIAVGTAHGRYKKAPKLAIERIAEIHAATSAALVLHGGSGVPDDQIKAAIKAGIRKINFGTDFCYAFLDSVFETSRDKVAVDVFMKDATASVKKCTEEKMRLLGSTGRI
ncbi:MAG: class II fructose-bisphosphate aldolase, partial [Clostridia bacterium]|nr:class II fructose-bisphosphate aldolase [Clostridia bacterium]